MTDLDLSTFHGITLYSHPDDHYSHSARLVLAEKNIKYRLIIVDEEQLEDLAQINPYATLPTLVDPQTKLFKASIINEYLDDRYRQSRLYAESPAEKAQHQQLLWRIEQDWFRLADILLKHPDSLDLEDQKRATKELSNILVSLDPLFQHYPYFMAENFSIIDCILAPLLLRMIHLGLDISPKRSKGLLLYCKRLFSRESFQQSMTLIEKSKYSTILKSFQK